jgi:hypothetical protein
MKRLLFTIPIVVVLLAASVGVAFGDKDGGFDEFGYNYQARIFVGKADGVDKVLDGMVWDDPAYANDRLVMKWSKAWDEAKFEGAPWTCDAWEDNEWNGMVPGGSGETWHYKIVWVGPELENSPCWRPGGYDIWGQFEVIFSHGTAGGAHFWDVRTSPAGYGGY